MNKYGLIIFFLISNVLYAGAQASSITLSGNGSYESRFFLKEGFSGTSYLLTNSTSFSPELYMSWENEKHTFLVSPFLRIDQEDPDRTHFDLREFTYSYNKYDWELRLGVRKIFWGVAESNHLVVGSQARILYADEEGRRSIASAFNSAIADGRMKGGIVLGRDHHDVSGTDSPYRETANINDGSMFTADMSVQNFVGDAFRGATWVSLHNGGGVGWGEVINGGFGLLIDGTIESSNKLNSMLNWDVNNGIARRAWARNSAAKIAANRAMDSNPGLQITIPTDADEELISKYFND